MLAALDPASTVRDQVQRAVANGQQALLASGATDLGGLPMDTLLLADPQSGTAAYLVTSRDAPVAQLTAQRPGLAGWLGLADAQASKALAAPALDALIAQLNTAQAVVGNIDTVLWQTFAGQSDVIDAIYQGRVAANAGTANACDWLVAALSSQLGAGLPASARVNHAPVITSQPPLTAQPGQAYAYDVAASDADGDVLSYAIPARLRASSTSACRRATASPSPSRPTR